MSVIRILPEDVSNRIAAGEVVERPASVVKELVENALDAGADRISIAIQRGGRTLIRVVDNGCGMDREDAQLCLEAHATSKLREASDLDAIGTLGFRGEAIPSIASVSRFQLQTRRADSDFGVDIRVNGGTLEDLEDCGAAPGTTVTVRNLFFNVPARQKFLRAIRTEEGHIQALVTLVALSYPETAFELTFDGRKIVDVHKNMALATRIALLLGKDLHEALLPVDYDELGIRVHGFAARPGLARGTRKEQRTFVNGRPVEAMAIYHGIRDAYHTLVMKGRYAPVVLFVELPPDQVDINVHPAKREVRFFNDRVVTQVVFGGVQRALRGNVVSRELSAPFLPTRSPATPCPAPSSPVSTPGDTPQPPSPLPSHVPPAGPVSPSVQMATETNPPLPAIALPKPAPKQLELPSPASAAAAPGNALNGDLDHLRVIGRLHRSLILAQGDDGLVIVDLRAARERVVFEQMLAQRSSEQVPSQGLLLPLTVELSPADERTLVDNLEQLTRLGFVIEHFGGASFLISGVPVLFPRENIHGLLRELLDGLATESPARSRGDEARVARCASHAVAGASLNLNDDEIDALLTDLLETQMPYSCPTGKPTMISISMRELERRFGRQFAR